jgi:flagellar biosynthesis component FlhA
MQYVVILQDETRILSPQMAEQTEAARSRFQHSWGVPLPGINYRELSVDYLQGYYEISAKEQFIASGYLPLDERFCPQDSASLDTIGVTGEWQDGPPGSGAGGYWIKAKDWDTVQAAGFPLWEIMEYPLHHLEGVLGWMLDEFLDLETVFSLGQWNDAFSEISSSPEQMASLLSVLRALAREGVPLTAFPALLAGFLDCQKHSLSRLQTAEQLRSLPEIRPELPGNLGDWRYIQLPEVEKDLQAWLAQSGGQGWLQAPQSAWSQRYTLLAQQVSDLQGAVIVVDSPELRPYMSSWLRYTAADFIPVLSRTELDADKAAMVQKIVTQEK